MALGPRVKSKTAVRRVPLNLKVPPALRKSMEKAADRSGRSLGAEVEFRAQEYESLRGFVDRLLDDSVAINVAVGMETLRKGARTSAPASITNEETASLERAVLSAACIAELFTTVADHAGQALAKEWKAMLVKGWGQRIKAGDLADDFDIPATAAEISARLTNLAMKEGGSMASHMGATIGPSIWDVCFDKDDPLRSAPPGKGYGLMGTLAGSSVGLPPSFTPPLPTEEEIKASKNMLKTPEFRATVRRRMSEGQYPGMSEEDAIDKAFDDLFTMDFDEAKPNAKAS